MTTTSNTDTTFPELIEKFHASPEWARLSHATKLFYSAAEWTLAYSSYRVPNGKAFDSYDHKTTPVDLLPPANVGLCHNNVYARDNHNVIATGKRICNWGIKQGLITKNPFKDVARPVTKHHHDRWRPEELRKALAETSRATRTAIMMGVYTGQRLQDILDAKWSDIRDGYWELTQAKTGRTVTIPLHPSLRKMLEMQRATPPFGVYVVTRDGKAIPQSRFRGQLKSELEKAGLGHLVFHGLRKTAAALLAEGGATTQEIMALCGWKTSRMVDLYTKGVEQKKMAEAAVKKMENVE